MCEHEAVHWHVENLPVTTNPQRITRSPPAPTASTASVINGALCISFPSMLEYGCLDLVQAFCRSPQSCWVQWLCHDKNTAFPSFSLHQWLLHSFCFLICRDLEPWQMDVAVTEMSWWGWPLQFLIFSLGSIMSVWINFTHWKKKQFWFQRRSIGININI